MEWVVIGRYTGIVENNRAVEKARNRFSKIFKISLYKTTTEAAAVKAVNVLKARSIGAPRYLKNRKKGILKAV